MIPCGRSGSWTRCSGCQLVCSRFLQVQQWTITRRSITESNRTRNLWRNGLSASSAERSRTTGSRSHGTGMSSSRAWISGITPYISECGSGARQCGGSLRRASPRPNWDQIIANVNYGNMQATRPETIPWLCNTCHLPLCTYTSSPDGKYRVRDFPLTRNNYTYHFCSKVCRQIWWEDRDMLHVKTIGERLLTGEIQPADLSGVLHYMGLTPDVMGDDAYGYTWAAD